MSTISNHQSAAAPRAGILSISRSYSISTRAPPLRPLGPFLPAPLPPLPAAAPPLAFLAGRSSSDSSESKSELSKSNAPLPFPVV
jgi:hypothetical protein